MEPEQRIAALLLAGIMSDTVILKSPTTTKRDVNWWPGWNRWPDLSTAAWQGYLCLLQRLSAHASLEKAVRPTLKNLLPERRLRVGQVEVVGFDEFYELKEQLWDVLRQVKQADKLDLAGLMVTDIYSETTLFLAEGKNELPT